MTLKQLLMDLKEQALKIALFKSFNLSFKIYFKQIGILIPFFVLLSLIISKFKFKFNLRDEKLVFLIFVTCPILLMF